MTLADRLSRSNRATLDSAEFRTVLACCRWPDSPDRRAAIAAAAARVTDWDRVLRMAERHRVRGLLNHGLRSADVPLPSGIATRIGDDAARVALKNLRMTAETVRLARALRGVPHVFFKGSTLAACAYGSQAVKEAHDIDLLVPEGEIAAVLDVLSGEGFALEVPARSLNARQWSFVRRFHKDVVLSNLASGIVVEVHWRLSIYPRLLPMFVATMPAIDSVVLHDTPVRTLGRRDLAAYLAVHGGSDGWHRLKWIADFNALVSACSADELATLLDHAAAVGLGRAMGEALTLCTLLLGRDLPPEIAARVRSLVPDRGVLLALRILTAKGGEEDIALGLPASAVIAAARTRLRSSWAYKAQVPLLYLVGAADGIDLPLPRWLYWLYPIVRLPSWLVRRVIG